MLCLISYTVLQLRVRDFSALVCGVARVAVLFVEVHLLMVIISHVSRRGGPEILHFGQKATAPPPTPQLPPHKLRVLDPYILYTKFISYPKKKYPYGKGGGGGIGLQPLPPLVSLDPPLLLLSHKHLAEGRTV